MRKSSAIVRPAVLEDVIGISAIHSASRRQAMPYLPNLHADDEIRAWFIKIKSST